MGAVAANEVDGIFEKPRRRKVYVPKYEAAGNPSPPLETGALGSIAPGLTGGETRRWGLA